jgi:hypothetical protein
MVIFSKINLNIFKLIKTNLIIINLNMVILNKINWVLISLTLWLV